MKILKFGGTSVGSVENINRVISILKNSSKEEQIICVVSAFGGITDLLWKAGKQAEQKDEDYIQTYNSIKEKHLQIYGELNPNGVDSSKIETYLEDIKKLLDGIFYINELSPKTTDKLLSYGELLSSYIISKSIENNGQDVKYVDARELIITNSDFTRASVLKNKSYQQIQEFFRNNSSSLYIVPGFIAKSNKGESTTLGRGGSDYTAALMAAALEADSLEIWTDVSGVYTANPKTVKQAYPIEYLSYQEAMELSHFGAKVLYAPTIQPVLEKEIPIKIKNTLNADHNGSTIGKAASEYTNIPVKGISNINNISLITLQGSGMVGIPGISKRLFETLAREKINVIFITQASSEHSICIGIDESESELAKNAIDAEFSNEIDLNKIDPLITESKLSIVALIGDKMKNHQGISGRMFSTLGKNNINIRAIAQGASEKNISAVIAQDDVKKALNSLHEHFFETKTKQLNVFITGVGNVGEKLIEQIKSQQEFLKKSRRINLRITGLSNSRKMVVDKNGIDLRDWKSKLDNGEEASLDHFFEKVKLLNLRNSIFVDITASDLVPKMYPDYLKESIAVVACNKIACSSSYDYYEKLKKLSAEYSAPFLFETNVGAGLPILDTLSNLINSGDKIIEIHAVLSGSLNYVFNNYNTERKFASIVKQAQDEGYTEPDPRIDLSGVDVARKILILARESGIQLELDDISNESFLTQQEMEADKVSDFYESLESNEKHYDELYQKANEQDCRLKYVAILKDGKASVGLKHIPVGHPFYDLHGKDNIVMFYTNRYKDQPLIVKGAGAGAEVTASGLFADIIRVSNR